MDLSKKSCQDHTNYMILNTMMRTSPNWGNPHFKKRSVYLGGAQIAFEPHSHPQKHLAKRQYNWGAFWIRVFLKQGWYKDDDDIDDAYVKFTSIWRPCGNQRSTTATEGGSEEGRSETYEKRNTMVEEASCREKEAKI